MKLASQVIWRSLRDFVNDMLPLMGMNALWLAFSVVVGAISFLFLNEIVLFVTQTAIQVESAAFGLSVGVAVLVLVAFGPNPAAAGVHLYVSRMIKEERYEFGVFWEGLRRYGPKSALLFLISLVGLAVTVSDAIFYLRNGGVLLTAIGVLWLWATYVWLSMQIYILPLLIEQEDKRLRYVIKNAAILAVANPLFTFILVALLTIVSVFGLVLPPEFAPVAMPVYLLFLILLTGSFSATVGQRALLTLMEKYRPSDQQSRQ